MKGGAGILILTQAGGCKAYRNNSLRRCWYSLKTFPAHAAFRKAPTEDSGSCYLGLQPCITHAVGGLVLTHARKAGPGKKSASCEGCRPKLVKVAVSRASMPSGMRGMLMPCSAIQSSSASHLYNAIVQVGEEPADEESS